MDAHTIWTGNLVMGLVEIPVKLFASVKELDPEFQQYHTKCDKQLRHRVWCECCKEEVPTQDIKKGYKVSKAVAVFISKEEVMQLEEPAEVKQIRVLAFTDPSTIDLTFWDKNYWLSTGSKHGVLSEGFYGLYQAMVESGKAAICHVMIRSRSYFAVLQPRDDIFALSLIHFEDEVVAPSEIPREHGSRPVRQSVIDMMKEYIECETKSISEMDLRNQYRIRFNQLLESKPAPYSSVA